MAKGCQNRGCKRQVIHQSKFCRIHTPVPAIVVPPSRISKKPPASRSSFKPACCNNFSLANSNLEAIQSTISKRVLPALTDYKEQNRWVRVLVPLQKTVVQELLPLLLQVVAEATKLVAFPLKHPRIHAPLLVVAPKSSAHSNAWTKGKIHRDFDCVETSGVCSFLLFLDDVTPDNGTIEFWKNSKSIGPLDPRHPERAVEKAGLTSESLLGNEGKVHVWDARLLHRSLANRTQRRRLALQWMVTSVGTNGVKLSVAV